MTQVWGARQPANDASSGRRVKARIGSRAAYVVTPPSLTTCSPEERARDGDRLVAAEAEAAGQSHRPRRAVRVRRREPVVAPAALAMATVSPGRARPGAPPGAPAPRRPRAGTRPRTRSPTRRSGRRAGGSRASGRCSPGWAEQERDAARPRRRPAATRRRCPRDIDVARGSLRHTCPAPQYPLNTARSPSTVHFTCDSRRSVVEKRSVGAASVAAIHGAGQAVRVSGGQTDAGHAQERRDSLRRAQAVGGHLVEHRLPARVLARLQRESELEAEARGDRGTDVEAHGDAVGPVVDPRRPPLDLAGRAAPADRVEERDEIIEAQSLDVDAHARSSGRAWRRGRRRARRRGRRRSNGRRCPPGGRARRPAGEAPAPDRRRRPGSARARKIDGIRPGCGVVSRSYSRNVSMTPRWRSSPGRPRR